ncbi:MAG: serine hydrolase domain-containing protein [Pseudomonadota bacterium]
MRNLILGLAICAGGGASADSTGEALSTAFRGWANEQNVDGAVAVFDTGTLVATAHAGRDPRVAYPVLSNSKAITGACIIALVDQETLAWTDPVGDHLPDIDARKGPLSVTLAQLVTHSAGLNDDSTQDRMDGWLGESGSRHLSVTEDALNVRIRPWHRDYVRYTNENFAVLGAAIDHVTGDAEAACRDLVLTPAGASGGRDDVFGPFLAWGGWSLSAVDYGKFAWAAFGNENFQGLPLAEIGQNAFYGPGVLLRNFGDTHSVWHFGQYCSAAGHDAGAYFAIWPTGIMVSANFSGCPDDAALAALDLTLAQIGNSAPQ